MADVPNIVGMSSLGMSQGPAAGGLSQAMQTMPQSQQPDLSTLQQSIDNMHNDLMQHPWDNPTGNPTPNLGSINSWYSTPVNPATPFNADAQQLSPSMGLPAQTVSSSPSPMPMPADYAAHVDALSGGTTNSLNGTTTSGGPLGSSYGTDPFTATVNSHNLQGTPWPQQSNSNPASIGGLSVAGATR